MRKVVSTLMTDSYVEVTISVEGSSDSESNVVFRFPTSCVNPRVALQIATLLVSDPTIPSSYEKADK